MSVTKRSIPPTQPRPEVLAARQRLLSRLKDMAAMINDQIFALEMTGSVRSKEIDKSYERLAWAVDGLWEEQELSRLYFVPEVTR